MEATTMKKTVAWVIVLLLGATCAPALSQNADQDERLRKLEQAQDELKRQQAELAEKIQELKEAQLEKAVDDKGKAEKKKISLDLEFKDGFKVSSKDGRFKFQVGGRFQTDYKQRLSDDDPSINTFLVRRARIFTKGTLYKYYHWKLQIEFAGGKGTLKDGWAEVAYWKAARFRFGQFKQPFGYEDTDLSNKYWPQMEAAMINRFIFPDRDIGVMVHGDLADKRLYYAIGYFNGNGTGGTDRDDHKDVAARLMLRPFATSENAWLKDLKFGGAATYGQQEGAVSGGPRTQVGTRVFAFMPGVMADGVRNRVGAMLVWTKGPFGMFAEYQKMSQDLTSPVAAGRSSVSGWSFAAMYFLTGETANFKRPHPLSPFDPDDPDSGCGAWAIGARVDEIRQEKNKRRFTTGADGATQYGLSLSWYPNSMVRMMVQYAVTDFHETRKGSSSEQSLMFRFQIEY